MTTLMLRAPLSGWCAPLAEVPDDVFAAEMVGPGVAIDPIDDILCSPCDGEVISIAAARHAIGIRADCGAEILIHVGIDTVELKGEGFELRTTIGARVHAGAPLMKFDLDLLARRAKSLITPVVIGNADRFGIEALRVNRAVKQGEPLYGLSGPVTPAVAESHDDRGQQVSLVIPPGNGLHARPAAAIAQCVKAWNAEVQIESGGRAANAKSAVSIMALGVRAGDTVRLRARGKQATEALAALRNLIPTLREMPVTVPQPRSAAPESDVPGQVRGVIASRGYAIGEAVMWRVAEVVPEEAGQGVPFEIGALERARRQVHDRLASLEHKSSTTAREVLNAHLEFLDDPELLAAAERAIARGKSAGHAWRSAIQGVIVAIHGLPDPRMRERIEDLRDLESQVLHALQGTTPAVASLPECAVLIAHDLQPSQLLALDTRRLRGVCLAASGPTSHVALLAAAMGLPALVALGSAVSRIAEGTTVVLDAEQGLLTVAPNHDTLAAAEQALALRTERKHTERAAALADSHTADGTRVHVYANLGSVAEADIAVAQGAEGCGLLRTEFLFLDRAVAPTVEEQRQQYQAIATALGKRPLVVRTFDIGGDKPIAYLPLPEEENPALGLRGVRTQLWRPDLLRQQLLAILRVEPRGVCRILLPMVTDPTEIRTVRGMIQDLQSESDRAARVEVGAMIETPAAALNALALAREVDFLSIGTNDLTQYTLAMDRGHAELAHRIDGLHPAVLRLIAMTADAGGKLGRVVAVCGGLASDPVAVPVLIGLGIRELSVVPAVIPQLKELLRTLTVDTCRALGQRALELDLAEDVRRLATEFVATARQV